MSKEYDVVVVGGGHNTLIAAGYLAKAGHSVCVVEKNKVVGGGAVTLEVTAPGFKHDTHATNMYLLLANPVIKDDELGLVSKFGLEFVAPDAQIGAVFEDDTYLAVYQSIDRTCESFARFSEKDAETYRRVAEQAVRLAPLLIPGSFVPPIPGDQAAAMLAENEDGRALLGLYEKSAYDFILETFEDPKIRLYLMRWAAEVHNDMHLPGTAMFYYFLTAAGHSSGASVVVGGTGNLSKALAECIKHYGGEIRTETWVKKVVMSSGVAKGVELADGEVLTARKCVVGGIHPYDLGTFVEGLDQAMLDEARQVPLDSIVGMNCHWALHEAPKYKSGLPDAQIVFNLPADIKAVMDTFDDCHAGKLPRDLAGLINHNTVFDPTRAPDGKHVLAIYTFCPFDLKHTGPLGHGAVDGWTDEFKEQYVEWVLAEYGKYCTNMGPENVIGWAADSPQEIAKWSPSFRRGDIFGVTALTDMGARPTAKLAQYAVPGAEGLYLSGPFCHPSGSVVGGGRATAIKILKDQGADLASIFPGGV